MFEVHQRRGLPRRRAFIVLVPLAVIALACAPEASRASPSTAGLAGVNLNGPILAVSDAVLRSEFKRMSAAGVRRIRLPVNWEFVQPVEGRGPILHWLDRIALLAARSKIDLLPFVCGAPTWAAAPATLCRRCGSNLLVSAHQPRDPARYAQFVASLVARYGPGGSLWKASKKLPARPVKAWQVWNEPDLASYWPTDGWASEYADLLRLTFKAIRAVDPSATVVLAGLTNYSPAALAALLYQGKIFGYFNVAAMNLFTVKVADQSVVLAKFRDELVRGGGATIPIWITEWTWLSGASRATWAFPPVIANDKLLETVGQTVALYRRSLNNGDRLRAAYWYSWATTYQTDSPFEYAGLNRLSDARRVVPKPALRAWQAAIASKSSAR